eukprot:4043029-Amphidinium_carterae.1
MKVEICFHGKLTLRCRNQYPYSFRSQRPEDPQIISQFFVAASNGCKSNIQKTPGNQGVLGSCQTIASSDPPNYEPFGIRTSPSNLRGGTKRHLPSPHIQMYFTQLS